MIAITSMILAAFPNALLFVFAKLVTQNFLQSVIEKVLIYGVRTAAKMTTNTLDDDLADEVAKRLQDGGTRND